MRIEKKKNKLRLTMLKSQSYLEPVGKEKLLYERGHLEG